MNNTTWATLDRITATGKCQLRIKPHVVAATGREGYKADIVEVYPYGAVVHLSAGIALTVSGAIDKAVTHYLRDHDGNEKG